MQILWSGKRERAQYIQESNFRFTNSKCQHTTFAEPLEFIEDNAIRTKRLDNYINKIGLKTSSKDAERQVKDTHVNISNNTILRIIKKQKSKQIMR